MQCPRSVLAQNPVIPQLPAGGVPPGVSSGALESQSRKQFEELQRQLDSRRKPIEGPTVSGPEREAAAPGQPGGPKFVLKGVQFNHSEFLTAAELDAAAAPFIGREIDFSDLQRILANVNQLYGERGIITAVATLPPQTVQEGRVSIKLTEGRLGNVDLVGANTLTKEYVDARVAVVPGTVIDPRELSEKISRFNRTNDVQIRALLKPGSTFGLTDLQYAVIEPPTNTFQLFLDNQGVETTGSFQRGLLYRRYGLLGIDDRLTVYATNSRKTTNGDVSYNFPVGIYGTRLGVSYSRGQFQIIDGPFQDLDVAGKSQSGALTATHPIFVDDRWLIQGTVSGSLARSDSTYFDILVSDDVARKGTTGLSFTYSGDGVFASLAPAVSVVHSRSVVLDEPRVFALTSGTGSLLVGLPYDFRLAGEASWQYTPEDLVPGSQLFQIGGPTTVRGYPANSIAGDSGYLLSAELHKDLGRYVAGLDVFAFIDHGAIFSTFPDRVNATAIGAGVNWFVGDYVTLEATGARPLNDITPDQNDFQFFGRVSVRYDN